MEVQQKKLIPVLFKSCQEQIEDEGGNEEIEAQLVNKGRGPFSSINIKSQTNRAKGKILNFFIDRSNPEPWCQIGKVSKGLLRAQIPSSSKVNQSPAEMQPDESSRVCSDWARAVSFAKVR
ncbi:MAG: hypothetical protein EZS28_044947 [Streblomastix strix]|uniref:Uncharacterized protein n=1 Tax=Streblomastix strix TaxID=222440 RepID=A0A5J4TLY7_9EUKA|nr:MAG: hypothetical protein EZS28_044947 [Streblomastix strix]